MILDVRDVGADEPTADLCIVGGGAAGLTLAAALADSGLRIVVLEAGPLKPSEAAQEPYRGEVLGGHPAAHEFRIRAFGGSSTRWGGGCVPLDPIDFANRPWAPGPGWPIAYEALAPYYRQALAAAEAGAYQFEAPSPLIAGVEGEDFHTSLERFSRPTDFGKRWRRILERTPNVRVVLNATAVEIRLATGGERVEYVVAAAPDGRRLSIRATDFALTAGGLETVRLLLASNRDVAEGLGNRHGHLGRGYMCHTAAIAGVATFTGGAAAVGFGHQRDRDGVYYRRRLRLSEKAQTEHRILNLAFRLQPQDPSDPSHRDAILSALHLAKTGLHDGWNQAYRDYAGSRRDTLTHLTNMARQPLRLAGAAAVVARNRYLTDRKAPSIAFRSPSNRYAVEFHGEQAPNPDSRVTLSRDRDQFDMPRLRIDWRLLPIDIETIVQAYRMLAERLARTGAGRLDYSEERLVERVRAAGAYGGHHIGTARMAAQPRDGVVDLDGAVHGVGNLYVAGAAIMPTSGQANPTLTILALTYRLAAHLRRTRIAGA